MATTPPERNKPAKNTQSRPDGLNPISVLRACSRRTPDSELPCVTGSARIT